MILCGVHLLPQITLADPTRVCDFIYERISRKEPIVCRVIQHITDLKHLFWGIRFLLLIIICLYADIQVVLEFLLRILRTLRKFNINIATIYNLESTYL